MLLEPEPPQASGRLDELVEVLDCIESRISFVRSDSLRRKRMLSVRRVDQQAIRVPAARFAHDFA
jgi:hypothetical protein